MGRLVRFTEPRHAEVIGYDDPTPAPGEALIETLYSGISAGTELTAYRGSNPFLEHQWDAARLLFVPGVSTRHYPWDGWGSVVVGGVPAAGSPDDHDLVGRVVWGAWGHRSTAVRPVEYVRPRLLDEAADALPAVFAKIGAIALNAILDADIHVGEEVAVFGAGVPGQIVAQLARLNGARVTVVDPMPQRRKLAETLGAAATIDPSTTPVAETIRDATNNRGADVVIEMSGSQQALHEAVRSVAYNSRVVASGFFQGPGSALRLGEEFHHNRISIICSQISGVAPQLQHRWDELRMSRTVLALEQRGQVDLKQLISHVIPADDAPAAFQMLDTAPEQALQVVLDYGVAE